MNSKSKVLIVTNLYPLPWEPNRAMYNKQQFDYLSKKYDIFILVPVAWLDYFKHRKELININENHRYCPYFYTPKLGRSFYSWFMFFSLMITSYRWMKSLNVDFMLASWAYPEGVAISKIAKLLKVPYFLKVHGSDINGHGNVPSRAKQITLAANNSQGVISVSQALATRMIELGVNQKLIKVIYNGVNRKKFFFNKKIKYYDSLLFVGNLKKAKGVLELMDSFINIHKKYPNITLTYAGDGEMLGVLRKKINEYGLEGKVHLLGSIDHELLPELMQRAKLLILPSYNEGVPNVILESLSCGTPVVATAVGGITEVVDNNVSGVLVKTHAVGDVQAGIEKALICRWNREKISNIAKQFDWQFNIKQVSTLFEM